MTQVNSDHYDFEKYVKIERWCSYWYQINYALSFSPKSILIVGDGDGIVQHILKGRVDLVETLDISKDLNPTYLGSIEDIDKIITQKHFDLIICCQVLEHIPFEQFTGCLQKMSLLCNNVIVSLPYCHHRIFKIKISLPFFKLPLLRLLIPKFYKKWKFDGQHFWEVGCKNYPLSKIESTLSKYFNKIESQISTENDYHYFFNGSARK